MTQITAEIGYDTIKTLVIGYLSSKYNMNITDSNIVFHVKPQFKISDDGWHKGHVKVILNATDSKSTEDANNIGLQLGVINKIVNDINDS